MTSAGERATGVAKHAGEGNSGPAARLNGLHSHPGQLCNESVGGKTLQIGGGCGRGKRRPWMNVSQSEQ